MQYVPVDVTVEIEDFIGASDALEMQRSVDAFLLDPGADHDSSITSAELAGAGSGHPFILRIGRDEGEPAGSLVAVRMAVYMAADQIELPIARAAAVARLTPGATIQDELLAGGKQGAPFMGIIVVGQVYGGQT